MTKDEILSALQSAYSGPGSTAEGSFAGDILRACADAMAQLWSQEIDGLEYRAFVSTAAGDWLTRVCEDRGVARREDETDDALRRRTLEKLASLPASGNADHYAAWCLEVSDILRTRVLPLARGSGTVDIIAVDQNGRCPEQTVLTQVQEIVDTQRPVGADAQVFGAEEVPVNLSADIVLTDDAQLEQVEETFRAALTEFCKDTALRTDVVSYAKLLRLLLDCDGVADVSAMTLCGAEDSLILSQRAIPVPGTLQLREGT